MYFREPGLAKCQEYTMCFETQTKSLLKPHKQKQTGGVIQTAVCYTKYQYFCNTVQTMNSNDSSNMEIKYYLKYQYEHCINLYNNRTVLWKFIVLILCTLGVES